MVRTREEFIMVSCHELKSPLGGIVNALNLMDMAEDEEGRREGLEWAKATAGGMAALIDGVLEFSSLSRDDFLRGRRFSPQELLESVRDVARLQVDAKGLEFVTTVGEDVPRSVVGHEAGLRLAILNLVGNAVKYTDSGAVSVDLSFAREGSRELLVARVADTGRGIEEQYLDTVFEPFRRAGAAKGAGVGLGLAIVRNLIGRMGGTIDVSSAVGQALGVHLSSPGAPGLMFLSGKSGASLGAPRFLILFRSGQNRSNPSSSGGASGNAVRCAGPASSSRQTLDVSTLK